MGVQGESSAGCKDLVGWRVRVDLRWDAVYRDDSVVVSDAPRYQLV